MLYILLLLITNCKAYLNNWFPIVSVSNTDFSNPTQIRILGKDFVVWQKNEQIILQNDVCPHRCAPLSEGYIDEKSKNLRCAYHGWEFNEKGKNTCIPQSINQIISKKSCVKTYKTIKYGDIIWGYLGDSKINYFPKDYYNLSGTETFVRELPYSFYILLENFFDPAHVPFAHHKLQSNRESGSPIDVKLIKNKNDSFSIEFEDFPKDNTTKRIGQMNFKMPCHYFLKSIKTKNDILNYLHIFIVPIQEDKSRIFIHYDFNRNTIFYKIYKLFPTWLKHLNTNLFLDSDTLILHKQEQFLINKNNNYHNHKEYFMPTTSDISIILYKKWIKKALPIIPYFQKIKEKNNLDRKQILNRYEQHTKICKSCNRFYKNLKFIEKFNYLVLLYLFVMRKNKIFFILAVLNNILCKKIKNKFVYQDYIHNNIK
jgi:phenylpropionate dioxygenase-like ring-hydroxylating dioxygenase large terminal subunit